MNLEEKWDEALKKTEIVRARIAYLSVFETTSLPYIFLAASSVNLGDTVVRKGKILVQRPTILLPEDMPQFHGFDLKQDYHVDADIVRLFLLVRGVSFPSLKYEHELSQLDVYEAPLEKAKAYYKDELEHREDAVTGLIIGPEDVWQLSLFIYVSLLIGGSAPSDVYKLWEKFKKGFGRN